MIPIRALRTRRMAVQLKEISIGDAVAVAAMPEHLFEHTTTEFLRRVIVSATAPTPAHVTDPMLWTVQERTMVVCHYLIHVSPEGADFSVGEGARLSDYLVQGRDTPLEPVQIGEIAGDSWSVHPLLGCHARAIEDLIGSVTGIEGRLHWVLGAMAAQMRRSVDVIPDDEDKARDVLLARMTKLSQFPESDFGAMMTSWSRAVDEMAHFFRLDFDDHGIIALHGGGVDKTPGRFPARSGLSALATRVFARSQAHGT